MQSKIIHDAGKNVSGLIWQIIITLIEVIVAGVIGGVCTLIPIIGWGVTIICGIFSLIQIVLFIIVLIGYFSCSFVLTDKGISYHSAIINVDVTFAQINRVYAMKNKIIVETKVPVKEGSSKNKIFQYAFAEDATAFCRAYEAQKQQAGAQ